MFPLIVGLCVTVAILPFNWQAALAWLVNGTFVGGALWYAYRWQLVGATIFLSAMFVAHAVGGALFFFDLMSYAPTGWSSVGNFDFTIKSFLWSYLPVLGMCVVLPPAASTLKAVLMQVFRVRFAPRRRTSNTRLTGMRNADVWFYSVIVGGLAVSMFMYTNLIGVSGHEGRALPFKLAGALFYLRLYIIPLTLFWLFPRTTNKVPATVLLIAYALVAGITGGSRGLLLINVIPLGADLFVRRRWARVFALGVAMAVMYVMVSRIKSENIESLMGFDRAVTAGVGSVHSAEIAGAVANIVRRFHGPQQVVLFSQAPELNVRELPFRFVLGREPFDDVAKRLYLLDLPEDRPFGVGIGLSGWITAVGTQAPVVAAGLVASVALLLVGIDWLLVYFRGSSTADQSAMIAAMIVVLAVLNDGQFGRAVAILGLGYLAAGWNAGVSLLKLVGFGVPLAAYSYAVFHSV